MIQDVICQQDAVVERNFTRVVEKIHQFTRDFTNIQVMSGRESDLTLSKLVLSNFTSSDIPGVKAPLSTQFLKSVSTVEQA